MKRIRTFSLVALALSLALLPSSLLRAAAASGDEQALKKIEDDWAVALMKRDVATVERITTADWTATMPDGVMMTRDQANADLKSGTVTFTTFKVDDLKIRVIGNTAVVHGLETEKSTYKSEDTSGQYRFTDVFVKLDGKWLCVATHVSKVVKK